MIGYDMGGGGGSGGLDTGSAWDRLEDLWNDIVDVVSDIATAVWEWVETVIDIFRWVRVVVQELYGVPMERWITHRDERTCPQCGALDGAIAERGEGDYPPAHTNCRCAREFAFTDWRTRDVTRWERQHLQIVTGGWQITGWS